MRKILTFTVLLISVIGVNGQNINGGFGCRNPKALFNKEIYFVARNETVFYDYYGYAHGQTICNAMFVVNGCEQYYVSGGIWHYYNTVTIESSDFKKGSTVELYINGHFVRTWRCNESTPSLAGTLYHAYRDYKIVKRVLKLIRKIK